MILQKIERYLESFHIPGASSILVACSGGPDSLTLLYGLSMLREKRGFRLFAAYIDHGLRSARELEKEARSVAEHCKKTGIPLFVKKIPAGKISERAKRMKTGIEAAARQVRYGLLFEAMAECGADFLATGHHADDRTETVIMRFFQGSGARGLAGIPAKRGRIIRPLHECSRSEVLDFCKTNKILFTIDSTNSGDEFLRNRIRHRLVPVIRELFPGFQTSLNALRAKMTATHGFIVSYARKRLRWEKTDRGLSIDEERFLSAPPIVRIESFFSAYKALKKNKGEPGLAARLPFGFVAPLIGNAARRSRIILQGRGITLFRHKDRLFLEQGVVGVKKIGYVIECKPDEWFETPYSRGIFRSRGKSDKEGREAAVFSRQKVAFPLIVRSWSAGDRIDLGFGRKKLKKLFQEWSVPGPDRNLIPVLQDNNGVMALVGSPFGYKTVIRKGLAPDLNSEKDVIILDLQPER